MSNRHYVRNTLVLMIEIQKRAMLELQPSPSPDCLRGQSNHNGNSGWILQRSNFRKSPTLRLRTVHKDKIT
jgi:hypothetical protein